MFNELVILIVDDVSGYLLTVAVPGVTRGYQKRYKVTPVVLHAGSGADALAVIAAQRAAGRPVRVLVTDANMPGMSGPDLIRRAGDGLASVLITGNPPEDYATAVAALPVQPVFLPKPQSLDEFGPLVEQIRELSAFTVYPDLPAQPPAAPAPAPTPARAVAPPPAPAAPPKLPTRHLAVAQHRGTALAVRIVIGTVQNPAETDGGAFTFGHIQRHFAAFRPATAIHGGEVAALVGQTMVAVFPDEDGPDSGLRRACRALADYRQRMTAALPTLNPTFSAGVCVGWFQTGVFGDLALGQTAAVGATTDLAMQLAAATATGRLGWVNDWLPLADGVVATEFAGTQTTSPVSLRDVSGETTRTEVAVG